MPKARPSSLVEKRQLRRHNPLVDDLVATGPLRTTSHKRKSIPHREGDHYVDAKASRKILQIGADLVAEDAQEQEQRRPKATRAFAIDSRPGRDAEWEEGDEAADGEDDIWGDGADEACVAEQMELEPGDLDTFQKFLPPLHDTSLDPRDGRRPSDGGHGGGTNLADLILEKIAAHEAQGAGLHEKDGRNGVDEAPKLPPKVVEVYSKIGLLLSRYKSGKLPKPFKILPTIPNWEELLWLTRPESWTANACYEATRIFVSGPALMTQTFLHAVMLERVRGDIHDSKKLNVHLYQALKRSLYKPAAFFKGFLFPLVRSGTGTLREAHIISSVLARVSIPVLHSAAALLRLCDMAAAQRAISTEAGGATNIFIRVLLEKKYALPYKVVDALVFHFLRFRGPDEAAPAEGDFGRHRLPVLWHQSLLAFAQRYRNDITEDQREALLDLLLVKGHAAIGPEVRRELLEGRGRGVRLEPVAVGMGVDGGDDTMQVDASSASASAIAG
ncbi:MAG: snoRNA-binding rRNA-processing protein [Phylliscum demangeonii]|nr:MAG: snoRNA-binding rRNA-processing protein [Phylliscum demangeonii]